MKQVTIDLQEPAVGHAGAVQRLVFREPRWRELMTHGDPYTTVRAPDGSVQTVELPPMVDAYAQACLVEPKDPAVLEQLGLADSIAVREAIIGFFLRAVRSASSTSAAPSSSSPASSMPTA